MAIFNNGHFEKGDFELTFQEVQVLLACCDEQPGKLTRKVANSLESQLQQHVTTFKQAQVPWKSEPPAGTGPIEPAMAAQAGS